MTEPFSRQVEVAALFESRGYREALARLNLMVENRYLGLLTGEVGSGKSTLLRRLFQCLDTKLYHPVYIAKSNLKTPGFLRGAFKAGR